MGGCSITTRAVFFCMAFAGVKTTPVKNVINSKSSFSWCLCEVRVVANGGYYGPCSDNTKKLDICAIISVLFGVEENLSVGPCVLCKKCYRHIEKARGGKRVDDLERSLFQKFIAVEGRKIGDYM